MYEWDELEQVCSNCQKCNLCSTRRNVVIGAGPRKAQIMLIGEGPGEQEDLKGEPFVGAAGQLLDDMLSIIDLSRDDIYITNVVKCRPPNNRDPKDVEQDACYGYLRNQIILMQPRIIVCLGRIAAKRVIDPDFRITQSRGQWIHRNGMWIMPMYHPSALLRDPSKRPDTFEDLLTIRKKMIQLGLR